MAAIKELMPGSDSSRAPRNRTLTLTHEDAERLARSLLRPPLARDTAGLAGRVILGDSLLVCPELPRASVDLLILDPPYNLTKSFGTQTFRELSLREYEDWFGQCLAVLLPLLTAKASVYVCGDWRSSTAIHRVLDRQSLIVRNRITWEREKGRGARTNWKNTSEDIWFATVSSDYYFNVDAVKLRRRVIAPYRVEGIPKDWETNEDGNFRLTHPSNLWTDVTVPFWSMPENTDHPTQKPEKLVAKLLLSSSRKGDLVLDPFLGSGTTAAVAHKLGRRCIGIEAHEEYAIVAARRIELATQDDSIQGYREGVFWERNSHADRRPRRHTQATLL